MSPTRFSRNQGSSKASGAAEIGRGFWPCGSGETGARTKHHKSLQSILRAAWPCTTQLGKGAAARVSLELGAQHPLGSRCLQRCCCDGLGNFCNVPQRGSACPGLGPAPAKALVSLLCCPTASRESCFSFFLVFLFWLLVCFIVV